MTFTTPHPNPLPQERGLYRVELESFTPSPGGEGRGEGY